MISLAGRSYPPNVACFVCHHVIDGAPIQHFFIDMDGDLQFLCDAPDHKAAQARIIALDEVEIVRHGLHRVPAMALGSHAIRRAIDAQWEIEPTD